MPYHLGMYLGEQRSVAIVKDGKIEVAMEQSRLESGAGLSDRSRLDHLRSDGLKNGLTIPLPKESIKYCLDQLKLKWEDLQTISVLTPGLDLGLERLRSEWLIGADPRIERAPSVQLAQAYSTYFYSPFEDAVVLIIDSIGSFHGQSANSSHFDLPSLPSYSIYHAKGQVITEVFEKRCPEKYAQLCTIFGIYEMMVKRITPLIYEKSENGTDLNQEQSAYLGMKTISWLSSLTAFAQHNELFNPWFFQGENRLSFDATSYDLWLFVEQLILQEKNKTAKLSVWIELLAHLQNEICRVLSILSKLSLELCGTSHLCLGGAITLDPVINSSLLNHFSEQQIYINPLNTSISTSIGCALYTEKQKSINSFKRHTLANLSFAKSYQEQQIENAILSFEGMVHVEDFHSHTLNIDHAQTTTAVKELRLKSFAESILKGHIFARFEGAADFGHYSLGKRVILLNPSMYLAKEIINQQVLELPSFIDHPLVCPKERLHEFFKIKQSDFALILATPQDAISHHLAPVLRPDGRVLVFGVDRELDPDLWALCKSLEVYFDRPPLLLMGTMSRALQSTIESPIEAIQWLLSGSIDALLLEGHWLKLRKQLPKNMLIKPSMYKSLPPQEIHINRNLLLDLDLQLFKQVQQPKEKYDPQIISQLAQFLSRYRIFSQLFEEHPIHPNFTGYLSQHLSILPNAYGKSIVIDERNILPTRAFDWIDIHFLYAVLHPQKDDRYQHRVRLQKKLFLHPLELQSKIEWAFAELESYGLAPDISWIQQYPKNQAIEIDPQLKFAAFKDKNFSYRHILHPFWKRLKALKYDELSKKLDQSPDLLPIFLEEPAGELIRFFILGEACQLSTIKMLLGDEVFQGLFKAGFFIQVSVEQCLSSVKIESIHSAMLITDFDHQAKFSNEINVRQLSTSQIFDYPNEHLQKNEELCLPIHSWIKGLAHLFDPQSKGYQNQLKILDLSNSYGLFAILAAINSTKTHIIAHSERALRFSHINLQFNGCEDYQVSLAQSIKDTPTALYDMIFSKNQLDRSVASYLNENGRIYHFSKEMNQIPLPFYSMLGALLALYIDHTTLEWEDAEISHLEEKRYGYWIFERQLQNTQPYYRPIHLPRCCLSGYVESYFSALHAFQKNENIEISPHFYLKLHTHLSLNQDTEYILSNQQWKALNHIKIPAFLWEQLLGYFDQKPQNQNILKNLSPIQKKKLVQLGFFEPIFLNQA